MKLLLQLDFTTYCFIAEEGFARIIGLADFRCAFIIVVPVVFDKSLVDFWGIFILPTRIGLVFNGALMEKLK